MDDLIEALTILRKYENPSSPTWCEHDTMHFCVDDSLVSKEDIARLDELGLHQDETDGGFYSFKFGNA